MSARASGETVTESQSKDVRVATNHLVTIKCTATFVTRYNASKKRRFITQIKSAKVTVSGYGFSWKKFCRGCPQCKQRAFTQYSWGSS